MGILDGGIQAVFGAAFGSIYLGGSLIRVALNEDGQGGGNPVDGAPVPIRVQTDACDERMRGQDGYTDKDVKLLVLRAGVPGGDIDTDCRIIDGRGDEYEIAWVGTDPGQAYWECRGTPA